LDFSTPNTTIAGPQDGNAAANRTDLSTTITGLSIPDTATFWLRWADFNASGADDGLAIDDFSLTARGQSATIPDTLPFAFAAAAFFGVILLHYRAAVRPILVRIHS
jgi:hypothetical protein